MDADTREHLFHGARNDRAVDIWSLTHVAWGVLFGSMMDPFWALVLLIAWEPFEILVLGPLVWRTTGKVFGHESWKNAMSDVMFDAVGVALGHYVLRTLVG